MPLSVWTRDSLTARMKAIAAACGHCPSMSDLKSYSPPGIMTWAKFFGSIRNAQLAAGLTPNQTGRRAGRAAWVRPSARSTAR